MMQLYFKNLPLSLFEGVFSLRNLRVAWKSNTNLVNRPSQITCKLSSAKVHHPLKGMNFTIF